MIPISGIESDFKFGSSLVQRIWIFLCSSS